MSRDTPFRCPETVWPGTSTRSLRRPETCEFTPAVDVDSNRVFIPTAFGDFTGTITGNGVPRTFTEPGTTVKGGGEQRGATTCRQSFADTFTMTDDEATAERPRRGGLHLRRYWQRRLSHPLSLSRPVGRT